MSSLTSQDDKEENPREKINKCVEQIEVLDLSTRSNNLSHQLNEIDIEKICKFSSLRELNLSGHTNLKDLPENICNLKLTKLVMTKNNMRELPKNIALLAPTLKSLSIRLNQFKRWPPVINKLNKLEELDIAFNELTNCNFGFKNRITLKNTLKTNKELQTIPIMTSLKHLDISFNYLTTFPSRVAQFQNLESLNLSRNDLKEISDEIAKLKCLKHLNLEQIGLTKFPEVICELTQLETLNLSNNSIKKLPPPHEGLNQLVNLKKLNLENCELSGWSQLQYQTQLIDLNLSNNQIMGIPYEVRHLYYLQNLKLNKNKITGIPGHIDSMESLVHLDFSDNMIEDIDSNIGSLQNLQTLKLSNNKIKKLPASIGKLSNLRELYLEKNEIKEIPCIAGLKKLKKLVVVGNKLCGIPKGIGKCQELEYVDLTTNWIKEIPLELYECSKLKFLRLKHNQIEKLHPQICGLTSIESINLDNNEIDEIPTEITKLTKLRELSLNYNAPKFEMNEEILKWMEKYKVNIPTAFDTLSKVIDGLFIGSADAATSKKLLKSLGITHVLTVACEIFPPHVDTFKYLIIYVEDVSGATLRPHFNECNRFIDEGIKEGGVVIHCMAGISRSATITTQYLMSTKRMRLKEAFALVKKARPQVLPNPTFRGELKRFDQLLFEGKEDAPLKPANKFEFFSPNGEHTLVEKEEDTTTSEFEENEWKKIFHSNIKAQPPKTRKSFTPTLFNYKSTPEGNEKPAFSSESEYDDFFLEPEKPQDKSQDKSQEKNPQEKSQEQKPT